MENLRHVNSQNSHNASESKENIWAYWRDWEKINQIEIGDKHINIIKLTNARWKTKLNCWFHCDKWGSEVKNKQ